MVGNKVGCPVRGTRTISLKAMIDGAKHLSQVLYVPNLKKNLLSISTLIDKEVDIRFKKSSADKF